MMNSAQANNRWVIGFCLVFSLILAVFPLSMELRWFRPEFIALLVIYWVTTLPEHFGVGFAWCAGILLDIVQGSVIGEHALALVVVAYVCQLSYQRIRNYGVWKQACWVFVLVGIHQLFCNWVHSLSGYTASPRVFLLPAFVSALLWPLVMIFFERLRLNFRIS